MEARPPNPAPDLEANPDTCKAISKPLLSDLSADPPKEEPPKRCRRCKPTRRDLCVGCIGFAIATVLIGVGIFIFVKVSGDQTASGDVPPLSTPGISSVTANYPGWLTIEWTSLDDPSWELQLQPSDSTEPGRNYTVLSGNRLVASNLTAERTYCFRVRGFNVAQQGPWSASKCNTTLKVAPPATSQPPVLVNLPDSQLIVQVLPPNQRGGYWDYGGDANILFWCRVQLCNRLSNGTECANPTMMPADPINHTCTVPDIVNQSDVLVWSRNQNSGGYSAYSPGLFCVNSTSLATASRPNKLPNWLCSRDAAPSEATGNISDVSSSGFTITWDASTAGSAVGIRNYLIQLDDWWNHKLGVLSTVATLGAQTFEYTVEGEYILPGTPYNARVGAVDTTGAVTWGANLSTVTLNRGACGNPNDLEQQRNRNSTMKHEIQLDLLSCEFDPDKTKCATEKVAHAMDWSDQCAGCWVTEGYCVQSNCMPACLSPSSDKCDQCARSHCFKALNLCTGLPDWTYPP